MTTSTDSTTTANDDAAAVLDTADGEVLPADVGPCTKERAEELVQTVIQSVNTFQETMEAIMRERAWEPLGYANPGELVKNEILGKIVNPNTGRPYGRTHIQNAVRDMMLRYVIAEDLGIEGSALAIDSRALKAVAAGPDSRNDLKLIQQVSDQVRASHPDGATPAVEEVQRALDQVLAEASGTPIRTTPVTGPSMGGQNEFTDDLDDEPVDLPEAAGPSTPMPGGGGPADDEDTDTEGPQEAGAAAEPPSKKKPAAEPPKPSPADEKTMREVLGELQRFEQWVKVLQQCAQIGKLMPPIAKVRGDLPEFIDNCDDDDLGGLDDALKEAREACALAEDVMATIAEALTEVQGRKDEAGY